MFATLISSRVFRISVLLLLLTVPTLAKDAPLQVIDWPATGSPVVRFTFSKFKPLPGMSNFHGYVMDLAAQNLSPSLFRRPGSHSICLTRTRRALVRTPLH
jgi:hypothetical protein